MGRFDTIGAIEGAVGGASTGGIPGAIAGGLLGGFSGSLTGSGDSGYKRSWAQSMVNNAFELGAWRLQNWYNSPVQQMKRLREAGLNPALVYGSGNVTGNSSASLAPASMPVYDGSGKKNYSQLGSAVSKFFLSRQMESAQNQNKIEKANEEAIKLDNDYKLGKLELQRLKIERMRQAMGSPSVKPVKQVDPVKEEVRRAREDDYQERKIRQQYKDSLFGRIPIIGSHIADSAYNTDYNMRRVRASHRGIRTWQAPSPMRFFGFGL